MIRFRPLVALLAFAAVFTMVIADADARPRTSVGSRGSRTYSAPPPTATTPNAAPINRSMTPNTQAPGMATRAPVSGPAGFFNRPGFGFFGGLMTGMLGAGLIGMLFGNGLFGGLGGFASILGLMLQIALVVIVARLAWSWWQRRQQPSYAGMPREGMQDQPRSPIDRLGAFGGAGAAVAESAPLEVKPEDFNTFERLLGEIQTAYGREDLAALRSRVTPEMLSYYAEELSENASRGVVNEITDVKLEQGDLSEAWREGDKDYATVAMRYSLVDRYVDRASGRVSDGNNGPQEATEVWTFVRAHGGNWILSAIQQT